MMEFLLDGLYHVILRALAAIGLGTIIILGIYAARHI